MKKIILNISIIYLLFLCFFINAAHVVMIARMQPRLDIIISNLSMIERGYLVGIQTHLYYNNYDECGAFIDSSPEWKRYQFPAWKLLPLPSIGQFISMTFFRMVNPPKEGAMYAPQITLVSEGSIGIDLVYYDEKLKDIVVAKNLEEVMWNIKKSDENLKWTSTISAFPAKGAGIVTCTQEGNFIATVNLDCSPN